MLNVCKWSCFQSCSAYSIYGQVHTVCLEIGLSQLIMPGGNAAIKLKRKCASAQSLITRLEKRLAELEQLTGQLDTTDHAKEVLWQLATFDIDFKVHQGQLLDLIEDEGILQLEQDKLDEHNERIAE